MPSRSPGPSRAPEHKTFIFSTHHPASSTVASESDSEPEESDAAAPRWTARPARPTGASAAAAPRLLRGRATGFDATAPRCRASTSCVTSACAPAGAHADVTQEVEARHRGAVATAKPSRARRTLGAAGAPVAAAAQPARVEREDSSESDSDATVELAG